jgi:hypothetical protein
MGDADADEEFRMATIQFENRSVAGRASTPGRTASLAARTPAGAVIKSLRTHGRPDPSAYQRPSP